jgi:hypothetical protein
LIEAQEEERVKAVDLKAKKLVEEEPAAEKVEKAPAVKESKAGKRLPAGKTAAEEGGVSREGAGGCPGAEGRSLCGSDPVAEKGEYLVTSWKV